MSDLIEDTHAKRLQELLTPEEAKAYEKYDRVYPSSTRALLSALRDLELRK